MNDIAENTLDVTRQENVTRILDAAERLFRHYGYSKTTVADIARDLGMSPANIYRFFASKVEIHQALCGRMLATCYQLAYDVRHQPLSASERLRLYVETQYQWTMDTMLDEMKVHEMIVVAIERDWHVIEKHIDRVHDLIAEIIAEGIAAGEFAEQDPVVASRCFGAATVNLCHPQMVAQCLAKTNRAAVDELIDYVIRALKK
ncbi:MULTISPECIES: TetR family transcriptional regulator [Rhizobium]|uniref:AcrR family transcriptional regulator n=1 Tax=Rhizobium binae TaxID=1138190 RepID=A0ABV2MJZ4_9HYPH|nr:MULTISPECIES: TetR family transcriptional regulator [Rhizobium]NKL51599.1 TetR family transcriptional regulator [Rhizobium leguminosarum bv. viciae]MBX4928165.1 TetR family transcriptional regulator [Rhizobium binae]MBX4938177.1 TetR family transcriptional regulator [Rhizobium binae]MBX4944683.1 TetR family transcriptional regulator [Rhizobium binae]MBX4951822.1 TetR family transcriptional regulator [Rhizobium binae]